jgi:hypothetical protein
MPNFGDKRELERRLEQSKRLSQVTSDPITLARLKELTDELENEKRDRDSEEHNQRH